jgi:hypothetical protein
MNIGTLLKANFIKNGRLRRLCVAVLSNEKCKIILLLFLFSVNFISFVYPGFDSPPKFLYDEGTMVPWSAAAIADIVWGLGVTKGQLAFFTTNYPFIYSLRENPGGLATILAKTAAAPHLFFLGRYPPGIGLTLYLFFSVFGLHFWAARLATTVFHIGTLLLFAYNLKRHLGKFRLMFIGGVLFSTVPMSTYFGRLVEMFIPALFFMTLASTFYAEAYHKGSIQRLGPTIICICAAMFYNWVGLILATVIFVLELKRSDRSTRTFASYTLVVIAALIALVAPLLMTGVIGPQGTYSSGGIKDLPLMLGVFQHRTGTSFHDDIGRPITLTSWILRFALFNAWGFTPFVPILAVGGIVNSFRHKTRSFSYAERVNGILAMAGVLWVLLLPQGVYVHMYYQYFLLPGEIYYAAVFLDRVASAKSKFSISKISVILVLVLVYLSSIIILQVTTSAPSSYLESILSNVTNR